MIKLRNIKANPGNPRVIRDERFNKLKASIEQFPKMMSLRPIVTDADGVVLGGNMRLRALQDLGYKEVPDDWVRKADDLTQDEQQRFIIADNVGFGDWDWDALANEWDAVELEAWGLDVPIWNSVQRDYSEKNKEIDVSEFQDKMSITLNYTEEEYFIVKEGLSKIAQTPEQAVWKMLGNE